MLKRRTIRGLCAVLAVVAAAGATAQTPPDAAGGGTALVDRIVAVVNDDPILASDIDRAIALELVERGGDEDAEAFRRRVLDLLIEERVRFQEIDRFGFSELPLEEVESRLEEMRVRFGSERDFEARLGELGLDVQEVRNLVARQLMVLIFVEERLGPRIFVDLEQIREYYSTVLEPEMRAAGQPVPPLEEVRESIRRLLKERLLNEEIERWTEELRRAADVEDYYDSGRDQVPDRVVG